MKKELGNECFGVLKTKDELENIMKDWPSGSHLVMEYKEQRARYVHLRLQV
jgi:hypothetical protein